MRAALLTHLDHTRVRLAVSPHGLGVGVVAMVDIPRGVELFPRRPNPPSAACDGDGDGDELVFLAEAEVDQLKSPEVRSMIKGFYSMASEPGKENTFLVGSGGLGTLMVDSYLNHGRTGPGPGGANVGMEMRPIKPGSPFQESVFVAGRDVAAGEELLLDYCVFGHGEQFDFDQEHFTRCRSGGGGGSDGSNDDDRGGVDATEL